MKKLQIIGAFCAVISISSHAELHLRQGGFVYDDVLDITWMQPSGFVAPNVTGPFRSANDAFGTIEWAKNLSIFDPSRNRTWDDWRLPSFSRSASDGVGNLGGQRAFTFVDCSNATEVACRDNEMGYMFHQNGISVSAPGPFVGLQAGKMWSSTEDTPTIKVYFFDYGTGQGGGSSDQNRAGMGWAVRDGDVGVGVATDGARILNLSTKSFVGVNDQRQVAGIVIKGSGTIRVGIKAEAPSLQGVANLLGDPKLTLKNALTGEVVAVNDNWVDGNVDLLIASNTVPNNVLEAAMVVDLPAGSWTALVEGVGGTTGIALVSVKEIAEESSTATLLSLSTKSFVGVNDERQVAGMVIVGKGTVRVLIKSVAPSLQNVQGLLDDPQLILKNALTGEVIKVNDNWQDDDTADEIRATGSAPPDSREAAMVVDLPAGSWTALVEGVDNSTGVALVSVTKLDFDAAPTEFNAAFCSQVAGTLNIHWEAVGGDVAPCSGVETTSGVVADATANGSIIMSGVAVSDSSCIGAVAYDFDLSSNTLSLTGSDTLNKIPMTLTRQASEACFVGHWIDGTDDYVAHISATAFGITPN